MTTNRTPKIAESPAQKRRNRWLGIALIVAITLFSFWLALNPAWTEWMGNWGYVGAFAISLIASATIVLPAPGLAVVMAMGVALDPILLGIVSGVGSACGEMSGYIAGATGRGLLRETEQESAQKSTQKAIVWLRRAIEKRGSLLIFLISLIPFPLFDVAGILAGALQMRVINFFMAVVLGKSIRYIIFILLAAGAVPYLQELLSR